MAKAKTSRKAARKPAKQPTKKPTKKPANKPANKPAKQPANKPASVKRTVNKAVKKAVKTPPDLAGALRTWIRDGGDLREQLQDVPQGTIDSLDEVAAICDALDTLRAKPDHGGDSYSTPLFALTAFFQQAGSAEIMEALRRDGLPRLRRWVHDALADKPVKTDDVLFILKMLRGYAVESDVDLVVAAVRKPLAPDDYFWTSVFQITAQHPHANTLMAALRDPLPEGFVGITFLDNANQLALEGALEQHPFDSVAGRDRLAGYLRDSNTEHFSYARSATVALPFLASDRRAALLDIAAEHPEPAVRIEAAWAGAKVGDAKGVERLAQYCLDPRHAAVARRYLEELGHEDAIPEAARDVGSRAVAELAEWLAHPSELGKAPDTIELYDRRTLHWPPTNDQREVALVRYATNDGDAGIGMVGSVTFVLFGESTADLPAEDVYGLHCAWELAMNEDPRAPKKRTAKAGRALLAKANPGF